jgi:hypothetical protein
MFLVYDRSNRTDMTNTCVIYATLNFIQNIQYQSFIVLLNARTSINSTSFTV